MSVKITIIGAGYVGLSLFNGDGTKVLDASWNDRIVDLQPLQKLQDQSWFIEWPEETEVKNRWNRRTKRFLLFPVVSLASCSHGS